jgi:hypothetical protein
MGWGDGKMSYSNSMIHFMSQDPASKKPKAEQSAEIERQTKAFEAKQGKVKQEPIRKYVHTLTKREQVAKAKLWGREGQVIK